MAKKMPKSILNHFKSKRKPKGDLRKVPKALRPHVKSKRGK